MSFPINYKWLLALAALLFTPTLLASSGSLQDFNGVSHQLDDFTGKGKWTIVMMWASDCHICNKEAHQYVAFHNKHQTNDASVLGISLDGAEKKADAENFVKKHSVNFPNLIGEPNQVAGMYYELTGNNFRGTPTFLIFSPAGELRAQQVGAVPTDLIEKFMASETVLIEQEKSKVN